MRLLVFVSLSLLSLVDERGEERQIFYSLCRLPGEVIHHSGEALPRRAQSGLMWPPVARPKFGATRELTGVN